MDKKQTALLIKHIESLYPGRINLEPFTVDVWHESLINQDYRKTVERLIQYARENKYPPSVADLYLKEMAAYKTNVLEQIKEWERNAARK